MDMLIKLYELPPLDSILPPIEDHGIAIRRAMAYERSRTVEWVDAHFNAFWADECAVAFGRQPIGCYIAVGDEGMMGFCCMDTTYRNFIGPIGTDEKWRRLGVGRTLLLTTLWQMRNNGYAYAVVGDVGQPAFFANSAGAVEIQGSTPGPYPPKGKR